MTDVLILGSAQYSDRSWVNCQHVAAGLSASDRVLFVDTIGLRAPRASGADLRRVLRRIRDAGSGLRRVSPNLAVLSPTLFALSPALLARSIRSALGRLGMTPAAVISYLPSWAPVAERFPNALRIYHCVDAFAENPGVDRDRIEALERRLLEATDVVLAVSPPLQDRLAPLHPDVRLWPNVAEVARFESAAGGPPAADLAGLPRPRVLYLGNLAEYKIDLPLLGRLARARPGWSWALVGPAGRGDPGTDLSDLRGLPQVRCFGERSRDEAPAYVAGADACILPLRRNASTTSSWPLKIHEYLAAGRPVVSTPIPAVAEYAQRGLLHTAATDAEWLEAIEAALDDDDPRARRDRMEEARKHGWPARIAEFRALVSDPRLPRRG